MGGYSTTADISSLAGSADLDAVAALLADAELDVDVLLARITASVALGTDVAALQGNVTTLLARITAAVALSSDMATVLSRVSAARAGYLDNLSLGAVALSSDMATVLSRISAARGGYLDNLSLGAVALSSDMATVLSRISAARAGYLDNLNSGGVLPTAAALATAQGNITTILGRIPGTVLQAIKLIQRGTVAFVASELSATMTVTAVDLTKAVLMPLGWDGSHVTSFFRLAFTNSTTVTASRALASATTSAVGFQIVEFN